MTKVWRLQKLLTAEFAEKAAERDEKRRQLAALGSVFIFFCPNDFLRDLLSLSELCGQKLLTAEFAEKAAERAEKRRQLDALGSVFIFFCPNDFLRDLLSLSELCGQKLLIAEFAENAAERAERSHRPRAAQGRAQNANFLSDIMPVEPRL